MTPCSDQNKPAGLGFGLGLRPDHYKDILKGEPDIDWFEIISENYMIPGGQPLRILDEIAERFPIVMHGVSLSIASTAPLDRTYLADLKTLASRVGPRWISDHLCWTGVHGVNLHDLLPIPYTNEALDHVVERITRVQEELGCRIAIENVSSYVSFNQSEMTEWEFLDQLSRRADCLLLLDINNVFVSAFNHGYDPQTFLDAIPADRVVQFHLAGHEDNGTYIIDTHDQPIRREVWDLYGYALQKFGAISTLVERDDNIPPLTEMVAELDLARDIARKVGAPFEAGSLSKTGRSGRGAPT